MVKSKCDEKSLTVDDDNVWEPLRQYQSKLEKLMHKATVEQVAAAKKAEEAVRLREEQQQQQQDKEQRPDEQEFRDVDMEGETTNQDVDAAVATAAATAVVDESVPEAEKVAGKKRLATPEEDEEAGADRDKDKQGRTDDVDEQASDNESRSSEQGVAVNETKRLRVR